jgi:hypothetical protein
MARIPREPVVTVDELSAIFDHWDKETGGGRDDAAARAASKAYVDSHPEEFVDVKDLDEDSCIRLIDVYRAAEIPAQVNRVQVFMWATFAKRFIGDVSVAATVEVKG